MKKAILSIILALICLSMTSCCNLSGILFPDQTNVPPATTSAGDSTEGEAETYESEGEIVYSEGIEYRLNIDKTQYSVVGIGQCKDSKLYIPPKHEGLPVVKIEENAFEKCAQLTRVVIPESVTSIAKSAFQGCTGLTSAVISKSVAGIGEYAFYACTKLADVTISDGVKTIGYYAFGDCSSLTSIFIPASIEYIGLLAFDGCLLLNTIKVDGNNKYYSDKNNCIIRKLDKCLCVVCYNSTVPDDGSVEAIGDYAFYNNMGIGKISVPNGVTAIGSYAFCECNSLTEVTLPSSITKINMYAFGECDRLEKIVFNGTVAQWETIYKEFSWNDGIMFGCTVVCLDGNIPA